MVTARLLDGSLDEVLHRIPARESTPPLYYLLAWVWSRPFGTGEVGLRSLSALLGTVTVPVAWLAARQLLAERGALVAAALVAVNPLLVWEGQEARAYALLALLGVASFGLFARCLGPRGGRRALIGWCVVSAAALATHYFAAFLVVPEAVWLLASRGRSAWGPVGGVALAGAALLPLALDQRGHGGADALISDSGSLGLRVRQVPKQWLVGFDAPLEGLLTLVCLVACGVGVWAAWRAERRALTVAGGVVAASLAIPLVLAVAGLDYLNARNCLAALPVAAIAVAAGTARRKGLAAAGVLVVVGVAVCVAVAVEPRYQRDDWRGAAEALGPARVERVILMRPAEPEALAYYLPGARPGASAAGATDVVVLALALREPGEPRAVPPIPAGPLGGRRTSTYGFERYPRRDAPDPLGDAVLLQVP